VPPGGPRSQAERTGWDLETRSEVGGLDPDPVRVTRIRATGHWYWLSSARSARPSVFVPLRRRYLGAPVRTIRALLRVNLIAFAQRFTRICLKADGSQSGEAGWENIGLELLSFLVGDFW